MSEAQIAIVYYSTYGHVKTLAHQLAKGVTSTGASCKILQVAETLSQEILSKMHAPPKEADIPIVQASELAEYDGILFGMPTRFGMAPMQMKTLLDATGGLWANGKLRKKHAGIFFSTGSQGGGQETTAFTFITQLAHHGMIYVPMGYIDKDMATTDEVRGGSSYGPGTIAGNDGSRQPSELELKITKKYGEYFASIVQQFQKGSA